MDLKIEPQLTVVFIAFILLQALTYVMEVSQRANRSQLRTISSAPFTRSLPVSSSSQFRKVLIMEGGTAKQNARQVCLLLAAACRGDNDDEAGPDLDSTALPELLSQDYSYR
jgi:hypothetical protein